MVQRAKKQNAAENMHKQIPSVQWWSSLPFYLLLIVLFFSPIVPDVKLTRPKLFVLETGLYGTLFLWAAWQCIDGKIKVRRFVPALPLALYAVAGFVMYLLSSDRPVALNEFKRAMLSCAAFLAVPLVVTSDGKRDAALAAWLGGSFCAIVYGILQYSGGVGQLMVPHMQRVMSTFGNPIFFAAHIVITLPLAAGLWFASRRKIARTFLSVFILAALAALFFTGTRAAYIGLAAAAAVFIFAAIPTKRTRVIAVSALVLAATVFFLSTEKLWNRQQAHGLIWRDTVTMWLQNPWTGTGPGTFHIYFPKYASDELKRIWPTGQFIVNDAHNEFLQYLSETGVVGLGIFIWVLTAFFVGTWRLSRVSGYRRRMALTGAAAACVGLLTQNIFSVDMRFIVSAASLFLTMGFAASYRDEWVERRITTTAARGMGLALVASAGFLVFSKVLEPYRAQQKVASAPDFFDEKVLEPAKTIADLQELAKKFPDKASIYEKLGWVYAKEKNWSSAIVSFKRSSELDPSLAGPLNNLGNIYFLSGDRTRAIHYWEQSLTIDPGQIDSRLNLATAYYYQGQLKEASDQVKEVLKIQPGNEKAIVLLKQMTE